MNSVLIFVYGQKVLILILLLQIIGCSPNNKIEATDKNQITETINTEANEYASLRSKTMKDEEFWSLIENSMAKSGNDTEIAAKLLTRKLQQLSPDKIIGFEFKLTEKLIEADHFNVMIPLKIMLGSVTDDPYLYFRCWLIFQGKRVFENTLKDPDFLAEHVTTRVSLFAEPLLYVSTDAYSEATGIPQENNSFPRHKTFEAGLDYSDGFIETKGEDWVEEDLPNRAKKLWKMFNLIDKE